MDLIQKTDLNASAFSNNDTAGSGGISIRLDVGSVVGDALAAVAASAGGAPAGAVLAFAGSAAPAGWLKANGALVSRTSYAALFAVIGTTYGAGDGSTTFALPDLRGEFLRGWDDGRGVDIGRGLGTWQKGSFVTFDPTLSAETVVGLYDASGGSAGRTLMGLDDINPSDYNGAGYAAIFGSSAQGVAGQPSAFGASRPRNVSQLYCIKF